MWSWLALILADTAMKAFGFATSNFVDQKQSKDATKMPLLGEMPDIICQLGWRALDQTSR